MPYNYTTKYQNALLAIIRICQRNDKKREAIRDTADVNNAPPNVGRNKFWKELLKTDNNEAAWLMVKWMKSLDTQAKIDEFKIARGDILEDLLYNFAQQNIEDICPPKAGEKVSLSDELMDLLALGLGPWPKGNGEW